ncbi:gamma carbonic anhydrase family protein [Skeletonema marinoi]|uniref:Gamma carbonic anhydrase family protein n=1 Tax=Skeletonema marinoi TaxID=267567 RepID=A0AAD8Y6L7_9STRA|nr:gamma carbonic anhydrase family protein [Skeletonema marinoi]
MKGVYTLGNYVPQIASSCWVAPNAAIIGNVILEESCSVWFSATIRGDNKEAITIGPRTNVQDNSVLHADAKVPLTIGKDVTIGHQAMLHGCTIGDNSLIGIGATERIASLGTLLIPENKTIPDNSLVVGSPGKVIRKLSEEQVQGLKESADHYVKNAGWFKAELKPMDDDEAGGFTPSKL